MSRFVARTESGRAMPIGPSVERVPRQGARKESVASGLAAAAAKLSDQPVRRNLYLLELYIFVTAIVNSVLCFRLTNVSIRFAAS